jgi:hypothetical protein
MLTRVSDRPLQRRDRLAQLVAAIVMSAACSTSASCSKDAGRRFPVESRLRRRHQGGDERSDPEVMGALGRDVAHPVAAEGCRCTPTPLYTWVAGQALKRSTACVYPRVVPASCLRSTWPHLELLVRLSRETRRPRRCAHCHGRVRAAWVQLVG